MIQNTHQAVRKSHHHGDLRAALLKAATEHVRKEGAASFSLRHASAGAGVTPGAAYRHFTSRSDVLDAVVVEGFGMMARLMSERGDGLRASDCLRAKGLAYIEFARAEPQLFALMFDPEGARGRARALESDFGVPNPSDQLRRALHFAGVQSTTAYDQAWGLAHGLASLVIAGATIDEKEVIGDFVEGLTAESRLK